MRKLTPVLFFLSFVYSAQAQQFVNGQAARAVIGQTNFTLGNSLSSQIILGGPGGVAFDPVHQQLYVADSNRVGASANGDAEVQTNRVLVFGTTQIPAPRDLISNVSASFCYLCGYPANLSLGQPSFNPTDTSTGGSTAIFDPGLIATDPTKPYLNKANGVATDGKVLAVADTDNNRILIWTSIPTSMNQVPNLVLGQPDLSTLQSPPSVSFVNSTTLRAPQGLWIKNNRLFVADTVNNRVLIWNSIPTVNNQPPDLELGQPDFGHNTQPGTGNNNPSAAANQLYSPTSVTSDGTHVFVSDLGFNRVLIWNSIPTSNGQNADVVIGQPDMTQTAVNNANACSSLPIGFTGACQTNLNFPRFVLPDDRGRLFIADGGNDRVLIFNTIPTVNGTSADGVIGQPDFVSDLVSSAAISIASTAIDNTGAVDTTPTPTSLAWDGTNLYVADPFNRRVLLFSVGDTQLYSNPFSNPPIYSIVNWASETVRQEGLVQFAGTIVANDTATVTIQSVDYTYTVKSTDTLDTIAQGLVAAINSKPDLYVTASFAGVNTGTLYLSSIGVGVAYDTITLAASTNSPTTVLVATASGGYLTAGNAATGSAGMLIEVDAPAGTTFTDTANIYTAPMNGTDPLPTTLGGVQLYLDGYQAPLVKVSRTQVVGQIPYYYSDRNSTSVYVRSERASGVNVTNAAPIYMAPANPGIFNAPGYPNQPRPWPASQAYHQPGNATSVISIDGSVQAADVATITINGVAYNYTVVATDTLLTIAQGLAAKVNATDPLVTATLGGAFDRIVLTAKQPGAAGVGITIAGSASTSADVTVTPYSLTTCCNVTPGSAITPSNPAGPGELITVNATGLGIVNDVNGTYIAAQTGYPYSKDLTNPAFFPNSATSFVAATMGGSTAQVITAGLNSGQYGVYGVLMVVPTSLTASNSTQLYIAQNAFISNTVTLSVGTPIPGAPPSGPTATPSPITTNIDSPAANSTASGVITVYGWSIDSNNVIVSAKISVDGNSFGSAYYGSPRPDVCAAYPGTIGCPSVGWAASLDTTSLPNGPHNFQVTVTDANGVSYTSAAPFVVSNNTNASTHAFIDIPGPGYTYHGSLTFSGWALDDNTSISTVQVSVDGALRGNATYGAGRPDVCAAYPGRAGCPNVGWSYFFDTGALSDGTHSFAITAIAANGQKTTVANSFVVANQTPANPVIITIDTPGASSGAFSGTAVFGGWALNSNGPINSVTVAVDGIVYGNAAYGQTRNDVCAAYPNYAGCPNVGWVVGIDTTELSDGVHSLSVTANPASGQGFTTTTQFSVANLAANSLRINVDGPSSSGAVNGITNLWGWAFSSNSTVSNVQVSVDGVLKGMATYGDSRPDVCAAYPGLPNCNVGYTYNLNTTQLTDGNHLVEITTTSATGQRATASSPFTVLNGASAQVGPARVQIDAPNGVSNPYNGIAQFYGWAINDNYAVTSVSITVDGVPYGNATYGASRPDVCTVFAGRAGCPNVGWAFTLDTTRFSDGVHSLGVTEMMANGTFSTATSSFTVANWSGANPMQIQIDSPLPASPLLFGTIPLYGWVVNGGSAISGVMLAVDGVPIGNGNYGAPRPDVCSVFASANCPNVGWSYTLDSTMFTNGTHTLAVTGITAQGQTATKTVSFTLVN